MLRTIFVFGIIAVGVVYAFQGPFYLLLFYLWDAYFRPEVWMWTDYVSALRLSLTAGIVLLLTSLNALQRFRFSTLNILIVGFLCQSVLSTFTSEHFDWSLSWWVDFCKVVIISLLITVLVNDRGRYRTTLLVIGLSLGLEEAKQGWAQLVLNPGSVNNNPHPVLGDNNGVAVGLLMLVPVFIALAQTATKRWERYLHRFMVVGLLFRSISTYSRGGFLAAGALGLIALWRSPQRVRALVSVAVLSVLLFTVMPHQFWDRMQTITAPAEERDTSEQGRLYFWQVAVRMANAKPIVGVGFNGYASSFGSYDFSGGEFGGDRAVHSTWFGVLAEMGYPGFVLFVGIVVVALRTCARVRKGTRNDAGLQDLAAYARGMQTTFVVYVVGNSFLNAQYNEMFWHMVGLTVALGQLYESARQPVDVRAVAAHVARVASPGGVVPAPVGAPALGASRGRHGP